MAEAARFGAGRKRDLESQSRAGFILGRRLVQTLLEEARELEIKRVFALTYQPGFFERCGFRLVQKEEMPQKVWKECINCPKFPHCDEVAVLYELT
ncbi:MAG: hypothetical protein K6U03_00175 [Firmicutes bacterium]|nr:hypothetical protein [Bacillota bacterium]